MQANTSYKVAHKSDENTAKKGNFFLYISVLNVLSAIAVIILHANGAMWYFRNDYHWFINNLIESLFYFAVPCFFMMSGATLLDYRKKYTTKVFLQRRISKVLIPFLFWSVCGFFFDRHFKYDHSEITFSTFFNGILNAQFMPMFLFMLLLFALYLSMPILSALKSKLKNDVLIYMAATTFIINSVLPGLIQASNYFLGTELRSSFSFPVAATYAVFYAVVGYLLHSNEIKKKHRYIIYTLAIAGFLIHCLGTFFLSVKNQHLVDIFKGYYNVPCVLYSIGIFVFVKYASRKIRSKAFIKCTLFIQKYTFAFYMTHYFIQYLLGLFLTEHNIWATSLKYPLILTIATVPICIVFAAIIRKIPLLRKLVP